MSRSAGGTARMMRSFALVYRAVGHLSRIVALAGITMLAGAMAITMADILLRRMFAFAMIGTVDMVQLCIMSTAFLSIPYAFVRGSHVGIEAATDLLPARALALVKATAALAGFGFMVAIGWFEPSISGVAIALHLALGIFALAAFAWPVVIGRLIRLRSLLRLGDEIRAQGRDRCSDSGDTRREMRIMEVDKGRRRSGACRRAAGPSSQTEREAKQC